MGVWEYFVKAFLSSFKTPFVITGIFLAFIPVIREIIVRNYPQYEEIMKPYLLITIPLALLLFLFFFSLFMSGYNIYKQDNDMRQQQIINLTKDLETAKAAAIPNIHQLMIQSYFKDTIIPLVGMLSTSPEPFLKNKTFENCTIVGPAIVVVRKSTIAYSTFDGNPDVTFIVTTNKALLGAILLENVTFMKCRFINVAFIGNQKEIDELKKGFSLPPK